MAIKGKIRYGCIVESYELDIVNQDLLIDYSKFQVPVLLSFSIMGNKLHITVDPQVNVQMDRRGEVVETDWKQIKEMQGPSGVEGPASEEV